MAQVRDMLCDITHRVEEALHTLEELARVEWERNVSVKHGGGRLEAAALTLENSLEEWGREPLLSKKDFFPPGFISRRTVDGLSGRVKSGKDGHLPVADKPQLVFERSVFFSEETPERFCEGKSREFHPAPLFAHVGPLPSFLGRRRNPINDVGALHSTSQNEDIPTNLRRESETVDSLSDLPQANWSTAANRTDKPLFGWLGNSRPITLSSDEGTDQKEARTWLEEVGNETRRYFPQVNGDGSVGLGMEVLLDKRPLGQKLSDGFRDKFFPVGFPDSVAEGYQVYSQWRAVQHFTSAVLGVLSSQSVLFAAGLIPTPAQSAVASWVLKEGLQHVGKLAGSSMGPRMDADPKKWRILSDVMYDFGAACEIASPLVPGFFLPVAGAANLAKGVALLAARSTRLPIYTAFAKHGNVGDLYAKGEALSVLSNVAGMFLGLQLASGACASVQGKMLAFPVLSGLHVFCVAQEMRAAPMNFLNAQRTALLVEDYVKHGVVRTPPELRYREKLLFPPGINMAAGGVRIGAPLRTAVRSPKEFAKLSHVFKKERFLLNVRKDGHADLVVHRDATGEDVLRGWLLAGQVAADASRAPSTVDLDALVKSTYEKLGPKLPAFLAEVKRQGWQTKQFHEGAGKRAVW